MQGIRHDGSKGLPTHFDEKVMKEMLDDPAVKEVRVFKEPDKILLVGDDDDDKENIKKTLERQVSKIEVSKQQQQSTIQETPAAPRRIKGFLLQKGMKINLHGTLYKVVTARSNGKATVKFIRFIEEHERSST